MVNKKGIDILDIATGTIGYLNNKQGIPEVNTDVGSVAQDSSGNIILSTAKGIVIYSPVEKTRLLMQARLSSSCCTELAPIKTEVTLPSFSNQANAICAND